MKHTEDTRVKIPAILHLIRLGYSYFPLKNAILDKLELIQKENQKLVELRDWLLPMLMNGQVKVN